MCLEASTTFYCRHTFVKVTICPRDGNCRMRYTSDCELRFCERCRVRASSPKGSGKVDGRGGAEEKEEEEEEDEGQGERGEVILGKWQRIVESLDKALMRGVAWAIGDCETL